MKLLILGGNGMIGHVLLEKIKQFHEVKATLKNNFNTYKKLRVANKEYYFDQINILDFVNFQNLLQNFYPDVVINAIGVTKQRIPNYSETEVKEINSIFPHKLDMLCNLHNIKLIHLSTDCVFSGKKGLYSLNDVPDAKDLYGKSKIAGEINDTSTLTIRKSTVGYEIDSNKGLLEWFINQKGYVNGYINAIFSGVTTLEFAKVLLHVIEKRIDLKGIYHVSSDPIDKFTLLSLIKNKLELDSILIRPYKDFKCDRSLDGSIFFNETNYKFPSWELMIDEMISFRSQK